VRLAPPAGLRVGLLSDTHGLLRPQARNFLLGCDFIVHAGDVGDASILEQLDAIAPLTVVRGNNDTEAWGHGLPERELIRIGELFVYVLHDLSHLRKDDVWQQAQVVVSGHSHKPRIERRDGVLFVNPGSCGPRRFKLPISVAELHVSGGTVEARLVELDSAR
jgi:putative phosphoesterase